MARPGLLRADELRFLRALNDAGVDYLVVGLSAAALQGAPAVTQDVDLWFKDLSDPGILLALKKVGGIYVAPTGSTPPMFAGTAVSLFDVVTTMHGLKSFDEERKGSVTLKVEGVALRVLPLDRIIAGKKVTNRPKDRAILPALEAAARVLRSRRRRR